MVRAETEVGGGATDGAAGDPSISVDGGSA
jgi:hypothetical protein